MLTLLKILDAFIPEHLKASPDALMKCYVLLGVIFSNLLFSVLTLFAFLWWLEFEDHIKPIALAIDLATFIGYSLTLLVFWLSKSVAIASNCFLLVLAVTIFPPVLLTGGYQVSPVIQMYMLVPVTAFLLTGLKGGFIWTAITIASVLGMAYAYEADWYNTQLVTDPKLLELLNITLNIMIFCMVAGVLVVYELINENLKSKLHEEKSKFEHRASHDALTGIPNRFEFFRRLNSVISECENRNQKLAVAYIDLDGFKPVNDQYGHHAGDALLQEIASRLQAVLRLSDTVARIGGDEFALILPGIHVPADINLIMKKVLAAIREPIAIDDHEVTVYGSAGVSVYPHHSQDSDTLCKQADEAMYRAKEENDTFVYYSDDFT